MNAGTLAKRRRTLPCRPLLSTSISSQHLYRRLSTPGASATVQATAMEFQARSQQCRGGLANAAVGSEGRHYAHAIEFRVGCHGFGDHRGAVTVAGGGEQ